MATQLAASILNELDIYNGPWVTFPVNPLLPVVQGTTGHDDMKIVSVVNATVNGDDGNDRIDASTAPIGVANFFNGGAGSDQIFGNNGVNTINGGDGNDLIEGLGGADILNGGAGRDDTLSYEHSRSGVTIDLTPNGINITAASGGDATLDLVAANTFENVVGSASADTITGTNAPSILEGNDLFGLGGNDTLNGKDGFDRLWGGDGDDTLIGGLGRDKMLGEAGKDTFVYQSVRDAVSALGFDDTVGDFSFMQGDKIDLSLIDAAWEQVGNQAFTFIGANLDPGLNELSYSVDSLGVYSIRGNTSSGSGGGIELQFVVVSPEGPPTTAMFIL